MRRFEKKQNIAKANLITEQRYLESKGLIKEGIQMGLPIQKEEELDEGRFVHSEIFTKIIRGMDSGTMKNIDYLNNAMELTRNSNYNLKDITYVLDYVIRKHFS